MAEAKAKTLHFRWEKSGKKGGAWMAKGTYDFLGLNATAGTVATTTYNVGQKTIKKNRYPGGPEITYTRNAGQVTRILGGNASTAKSSRVVVLKAGDKQDTVRFTGPTHAFVKWLVDNARTGQTVEINGFNGNAYGIINDPVDNN